VIVMRVLLTGATGFIGTPVLNCLLDERCAVTVLVVPETLGQLAHRSRVTVVLGGLSDPRALAQSTKGAEVVLHLAGKILGSPAADLAEVNVRGTENLLKACVASAVRRFVFISSAAVYRPALLQSQLPITEVSALGPGGSTAFRNYGESKIQAERLVLECHRAHGLEYSILRPTTAYGPSPAAESMESFLSKILRNANSVMSGQQQWRNMQWVHVLDLANATCRAGMVPGAKNEIFTIAGAELFNLSALTAMMLEILLPGAQWRLRRPALRPKRAPHLFHDITKARSMMDFEPRIDLRAGLSQMLEEMARNGKLPLRFSRRNHAEFRA
jgi:nucleoside-diphosphate-sugar epimerase